MDNIIVVITNILIDSVIVESTIADNANSNDWFICSRLLVGWQYWFSLKKYGFRFICFNSLNIPVVEFQRI